MSRTADTTNVAELAEFFPDRKTPATRQGFTIDQISDRCWSYQVGNVTGTRPTRALAESAAKALLEIQV